jgi:hypothetical protein
MYVSPLLNLLPPHRTINSLERHQVVVAALLDDLSFSSTKIVLACVMVESR